MRTLLLAAVLSTTSLCAQTSFAPVGATWTYEQGSCCSPDTGIATLFAPASMMIQGRVCSAIISTGTFYCYPHLTAVYASNDSVFYWDYSDQLFRLLYRMDASIGEGWETPVNAASQGAPLLRDTINWLVTDTGHITIDGLNLRKFDFHATSSTGYLIPYPNGTVIERLGNLMYLFDWPFGACDGETFIGLRCYSDTDITWLNPQFPQCDLSTGVGETAAEPGLRAAPSVIDAGGSVRITMPVGSSVQVIDATGRTVASIPATGDLTMPHTGLYFIRATSDQGQLSVARVLVR
jgi:hypothetical protein